MLAWNAFEPDQVRSWNVQPPELRDCLAYRALSDTYPEVLAVSSKALINPTRERLLKLRQLTMSN